MWNTEKIPGAKSRTGNVALPGEHRYHRLQCQTPLGASPSESCFFLGTAALLQQLMPEIPYPATLTIAKLKGKLELISQTKESQAEKSNPHCLHLPSISSTVGEGSPHQQWSQLKNWYSGCWADGTQRPQLMFCVPTPQVTLKRYKVPILWTRQGRSIAWSPWCFCSFPDTATLPLAWEFSSGKNKQQGNTGAFMSPSLCPN